MFIALFKLSCDFEWLKSAETNMNVQIWWVVIVMQNFKNLSQTTSEKAPPIPFSRQLSPLSASKSYEKQSVSVFVHAYNNYTKDGSDFVNKLQLSF